MPNFFVMLDEQSAAEAETLDEARTKARAIYDAEVLPCTCWIADADGNHVEDVQKSDGRDLASQIQSFNKSFANGGN